MGFTPEEVQRMTLDELDAAVKGWSRANGGKQDAPAMSDDQYAALDAMADEMNEVD